MGAAEWSAVAAVASAVSASIALASLLISLKTARTQVKVGEFNNTVAIQRELAEAQRKIASHEPGSTNWVFEFRELYNLLEVLALLINNGQMTIIAKEFATKFIIEVLAWTETSDELKVLVAESVTKDETFAELNAFRRKYRRQIDPLLPIYRARG